MKIVLDQISKIFPFTNLPIIDLGVNSRLHYLLTFSNSLPLIVRIGLTSIFAIYYYPGSEPGFKFWLSFFFFFPRSVTNRRLGSKAHAPNPVSTRRLPFALLSTW